MNAFICICSKEYINYYRVLYKSLKKHSPVTHNILYFIGKNIPTEFEQVVDITENFNNCKYNDTLTKICSLRAHVVLDAFNQGYKKVCFLGAKLEFYHNPEEIFTVLNTNNAFTTPHILEPLPNDGKFPNNASVSFTGHLSTDLVAFKDTQEVRKFLTWQDEIMKTECKTTHQTYLDQSWLNFLPFFVPNVHISRNLGYNVAYWNASQRGLQKINNKWTMKDDSPLVAYQFSGLNLERPEKISTHQNRDIASGDYLEFLKDYVRKIKYES